jgi:hypothetical protein
MENNTQKDLLIQELVKKNAAGGENGIPCIISCIRLCLRLCLSTNG